ncbi:unnamed protein product [Calicophoron daubneyi]|uniref:Uncharacterized protein n=1 Tax=Calicophoron daubneyi TaxID=300641 RepID=A0AAV2TKN1_CALDB
MVLAGPRGSSCVLLAVLLLLDATRIGSELSRAGLGNSRYERVPNIGDLPHKDSAGNVAVQKHPVVLVPGNGGCQAYCKMKDRSDIFPIWINLWYFLRIGSFSEYFSLHYDPETGKTFDGTLCDVVFPGWGETWSIENLDATKHYGTAYFQYLVAALSKDRYFVPGQTIRGAPFDFRKAPNENPNFNDDLKKLIEDAYTKGNNSRVILLGHSLGSLYSLVFLKTQSAAWKQKYVHAFLSVAGPLGGSVKALKIEASGDNFGVYLTSSLNFRQVQRSMPSLAFLLPDTRLWPPDVPLIVTPAVNYSAYDMQKFFGDVNYTIGYRMMQDTKIVVDSFDGPRDIDHVYCIHGANLSTPTQLVYLPPTFYRSGFPDQYPQLVMGDGDGTVSVRSLEVCSYWNGAKHLVYEGGEHVQIVGDQRLIDLVKEISGAEPT